MTPVSYLSPDLDGCIEDLRALIRIPSVNPPDGGPDVAAGRDPLGGEAAAARYCAEVLGDAGVEAEVIELVPGRGSCVARLRATGPATEPPLILRATSTWCRSTPSPGRAIRSAVSWSTAWCGAEARWT